MSLRLCSSPKHGTTATAMDADKTKLWISLVARLVPRNITRVCEISTQSGDAGELLNSYPNARLFGLSFVDNDAARAELKSTLSRVASLRNRTTVFFGDKVRTVRVAPAIDDCSIMVVNTHYVGEDGATTFKKLMEDMPNVLQRVTTTGNNALVMHGPSCAQGRRTTTAAGSGNDWCNTWDDLVVRGLVVLAGCTSSSAAVGGGVSVSWCVGRVVTDSACSRRLPLLPALPIRPAMARTSRGGGKPSWQPMSGRSRHGALSSRHRPTFAASSDVLEHRSVRVTPTSTNSSSRTADAHGLDGWYSEEVRGLRLGHWWRYFTLWQGCDGPTKRPSASAPSGEVRAPQRQRRTRAYNPETAASVCLIFKNHIFESWVGGVGSVDHGHTFEAEPSLVLPATWPMARMTHNLAIARDGRAGGGYLLVGGQYKLPGAARCGKRAGNLVPCRSDLPEYNGLWMASAPSWRFVLPGSAQISTGLEAEEIVRRSDAATLAGTSALSSVQWLFNGTHDGCIERRSRFFASMGHLGACEFDGRLSLVRFRGELRIYARANPATRGQRFVQTVASVDGGRTWGRFEFIRIAEYDYTQGDVYFFAVTVNPVHPSSLIALFPLAHKFRGCVAVAASTDGLRWSAPTPLLRCAVHGERTIHHPVQGFVQEGNDSVALYVHENVPGTTSDTAPSPAQLQDFPYLKLPRPRLVRHSLPAAALRAWTEAALRGDH